MKLYSIMCTNDICDKVKECDLDKIECIECGSILKVWKMVGRNSFGDEVIPLTCETCGSKYGALSNGSPILN